MRKLKIFTWHVHGSYLYYLSHIKHEIYIPVDSKHPGKTSDYPWPSNLHEIPLENVKEMNFDVIIFQSRENYLQHQYEQLTEIQRQLPKVFLEHDPPRSHPTDTKHIVDDSSILIIHVTQFNQLMWDCGLTPTHVIDHGVLIPENIEINSSVNKGVVLINNIQKRGRRLGADVFEKVRSKVPLDLFGMGWEEAKGTGELKFKDLHKTLANYRFFFSPIRYTSLGLSIIESMMVGLPVIGLATTELVSVIENEKNGFLSNSIDELIDVSHELIMYPELAKKWGRNARITAMNRFSIDRFINDWENVVNYVASVKGLQGEKWMSPS